MSHRRAQGFNQRMRPNVRMSPHNISEMARQLDSHLGKLHLKIQSTLQPFMEANGWSVLPPVAIRMCSAAEISRMSERPTLLRKLAEGFRKDRDALVQMTNRCAPADLRQEHLEARIYNMVVRLETCCGAYQDLAKRLQDNLNRGRQPAGPAPRRRQFEHAPPEEFYPPNVQEDHLSDDDQDWSQTQSRRRGGM